MTVYLVVLEDRHTDVEIEVFTSKQKAIKRAEQITKGYKYAEQADYGKEVKEWLYYCVLSSEGDMIHVKETEVIQ